jgi:MPBQ/MSBQ methyltransferase
MAKIDTRALGLDVGLAFARWVTGAENLHYGLWTGLEVTAGNLRAAQDAYTAKLLGLLPAGRLRILDVGGGAGVTAGKLLALGHKVEIVIPSPYLAARCRENAPGAVVHEATFQDAAVTGPFDVVLFSESFQYIPYREALAKAQALLAPGGTVLIADCFRSDAMVKDRMKATVGGGHRLSAVREHLAELPVDVTHDEDISEAVAPSIDLEAGLYRVFGHALTRVEGELAAKKPVARALLGGVLRLFLRPRARERLMERLTGTSRSSAVFLANNRYMILRLLKRG